LFFLTSSVLLNFVIPPFQNPDEPQHFGTVLTYGQGNENQENIQKSILSVMHKNEWWRLVGMRKPGVPPESFSEMDFLTFSDFQRLIGETFLYHFLLGKAANFLFKENTLASYYFCRLISITLMLASLLMCGLVFGKMAKKQNFKEYMWGVFFILFLPQFLILSVAVNPDSFSIFLGTLFFFAAYHLMAEKFRLFHLFVCILCPFIGLFTDRSLFFLVLMVVFIPLVIIKRTKFFQAVFIVFSSLFLFILVTSWIAWYFPLQIYKTLSLIKVSILDKIPLIPQLFSSSEFNRDFMGYLIDSSFLKFGWMAFDAHSVFYYVWRASLCFVFLGIVIYFGKRVFRKIKKTQITTENAIISKTFFFFLFAVLVQLMSVWIFWAPEGKLPQGRYLFPVILPVAFLFILGLKNVFGLFHKKSGQLAIMVFVLFQFFFFTYVVWNYLIPVFHLTVKSPHPGM
jgi:hypothetical protein